MTQAGCFPPALRKFGFKAGVSRGEGLGPVRVHRKDCLVCRMDANSRPRVERMRMPCDRRRARPAWRSRHGTLSQPASSNPLVPRPPAQLRHTRPCLSSTACVNAITPRRHYQQNTQHCLVATFKAHLFLCATSIVRHLTSPEDHHGP